MAVLFLLWLRPGHGARAVDDTPIDRWTTDTTAAPGPAEGQRCG
ncbi:MAG: hypothetical protein AB1925_12180 [Actinomycetota bacterium]